MPFIGEVLGILLALVLFLVFSYFASKYYSGRKEELEKRFYTNRPSNRILSIIITLIFILLPIFILIALIKFN